MRKNPVSALILIIALAIVPSFINIMSGAYVRKLETKNILLAAAAPSQTDAPLPDAAAHAKIAAPAPIVTAPAKVALALPAAVAAEQPDTAAQAAPAEETEAQIAALIAGEAMPAQTEQAAAKTEQAEPATEPAEQAEQDAATKSPHKSDSKIPFMAIPARILAESLAARGAAAATENLSAPSLAERPPAARQIRQNGLSKSRPDPSNLAPNTQGGANNAADFVYKIDKPLWHSANVVVLLHGSGANETTMLPFARPIWPRATLVGIRGRIMQGKERRWYRKITPTSFNQKEAEQEADALAQFISDLAYKKHWTPQKMVFIGYSNGANILAILAMKYPQLVRRAVLLRPMPVLDMMPQQDLRNLRILTLSGARDKLYGGFAEPLYSNLQKNGAHVTAYRIAATHMLGGEDAKIITRWLKIGY